MAVPKDQAGGCALGRPPQAWTMLGPGEAHAAMRLAWKTGLA